LDLGALTRKTLYVAFHSVGETTEKGIKVHNYYVIHEVSWHMSTHTPSSLKLRTTLSQLKCYKNTQIAITLLMSEIVLLITEIVLPITEI